MHSSILHVHTQFSLQKPPDFLSARKLPEIDALCKKEFIDVVQIASTLSHCVSKVAVFSALFDTRRFDKLTFLSHLRFEMLHKARNCAIWSAVGQKSDLLT